MARILSGGSLFNFSLTHKNTLDLSSVQEVFSLVGGLTWTNGTGANQINILYHDTVSIGDGANTVLNLLDGALVDAFGVLLTLSAVKLVYIKNKSTDSTLLIGGGASPLLMFADATDIIELPPGGTLIMIIPTAAGIDVTVNKNLKLEDDGSGAAGQDVDVVICGLD